MYNVSCAAVETVAASFIGLAGVAHTVEGIREPDTDFAALRVGNIYLATAAMYGLSALSGDRSSSQCRGWFLSDPKTHAWGRATHLAPNATVLDDALLAASPCRPK